MSKCKNIKTVKKIHKGRNNISIVKKNGKLFVLKQSKSKTHVRIASLRRQLERIKQWKKFGISKVKASWCSDNDAILKTYIKGPTLKKMIKKRHHFFSEKSKELKSLGKFVQHLVDSNHFIHDMKSINIIFDKKDKKWNVIDSGPIYKKSRSSLKRMYKKILFEKWSRVLDSKDEISHLKSFLAKYCR